MMCCSHYSAVCLYVACFVFLYFFNVGAPGLTLFVPFCLYHDDIFISFVYCLMKIPCKYCIKFSAAVFSMFISSTAFISHYVLVLVYTCYIGLCSGICAAYLPTICFILSLVKFLSSQTCCILSPVSSHLLEITYGKLIKLLFFVLIYYSCFDPVWLNCVRLIENFLHNLCKFLCTTVLGIIRKDVFLSVCA